MTGAGDPDDSGHGWVGPDEAAELYDEIERLRARLLTLPEEAIGLFLEYRDQHGYDERRAEAAAVLECNEGIEAELSSDSATPTEGED